MHVFSYVRRTSRTSGVGDDAIIIAALKLLLRGHHYSVRAGVNPWDFAVEIDELRRAGISNSDLRWLLCQNLAAHAEETSPVDGKRRFRRAASASLTPATCFTITEAGLQHLGHLNSFERPDSQIPADQHELLDIRAAAVAIVAPACAGSSRPIWSAQRRELVFNGQVIKQFRCPAPNQEVILDAFQASGWPVRVLDPLPECPAQCPKRRLHDAIKRLNRHHSLAAIRFSGDGSGRGVFWKLTS